MNNIGVFQAVAEPVMLNSNQDTTIESCQWNNPADFWFSDCKKHPDPTKSAAKVMP